MARYDDADQAREHRIRVLCEAWRLAGGDGVGVALIPTDVVEKLLEIGAQQYRDRLIAEMQQSRARKFAAYCWMSQLNEAA